MKLLLCAGAGLLAPAHREHHAGAAINRLRPPRSFLETGGMWKTLPSANETSLAEIICHECLNRRLRVHHQIRHTAARAKLTRSIDK